MSEARAVEEALRDAKPVTGRVVSHIDGRTRVRLDRKHRHQAEAMARVRVELSVLPGVRSVEVNPATGSILIHHDPAAHSRASVANALRNAGVDLPEDRALALPSEYSELEAMVIAAVDAVNRWIARVTGLKVDLRMLVPIGFVVAGVALAIAHGGLGVMDIPAFIFLWIGVDAYFQIRKTPRAPAPEVLHAETRRASIAF